MSEMPRIEGDAKLNAVYQAMSQDEPRAALDAAILAAAHRAVGARPRAAEKSFAVRWQTPLSIAAVLVLCVSMVAVMRDEGGELTREPRADAPHAGPALRKNAEAVPAVPKVELFPESAPSGNLGLKPPGTSAKEGAAYSLAAPRIADSARRDAPHDSEDKRRDAQRLFEKSERKAAADGADSTSVIAGAGGDVQSEPVIAGAVAESRARVAENRAVAAGKIASALDAVTQPRQAPAGKERAEPDRPIAAPPASPSAVVPMRVDSTVAKQMSGVAAASALSGVPPSGNADRETSEAVAQMVKLPPDQWLLKIEEMRKSGRIELARSLLTEFRRRYAGYVLPETLRDLLQP
jgi:hypothetical protein